MTAQLMVSTVKKAEMGLLVPEKQNSNEASYAPIIKKEMALLDFSKSAEELKNIVRGFNPWPIAYSFLNGKRIKIYECECYGYTEAEPCTVLKSDNEFVVACGNNTSLLLKEVQLEGGKRMKASEMLKGKSIPVGTCLGR